MVNRRWLYWGGLALAVGGLIATVVKLFALFSARLSSSAVTTDDAYQQLFPFWEWLVAGSFSDDFVTEAMSHYLPPLHEGITGMLTLATGHPVLAGHVVGMLQIGLAALGVFFAVRAAAGNVAACAAVTWFLHVRRVLQRMTGGVPRGWGPGLLATFLALLLLRRHKSIAVLLVFAAALQPVSAFLIGVTWSLFWFWEYLRSATRADAVARLPVLFTSGVVACAIAVVVVRGGEGDFGPMITLQEALVTPEMQHPHGRFPFAPLPELVKEIRSFAFQAFEYRAPAVTTMRWWLLPVVVVLAVLLIQVVAWQRRSQGIPAEILVFLVAALGVYLLSRELAFLLYVPDRHLQAPFAIASVIGITIGAWRMWGESSPNEVTAPRILSLLVLVAGVSLYTGSFDRWSANYNRHDAGGALAWMREATPPGSRFIGHPDDLDPVPLFGARQVVVSTEVAHPFYERVRSEMRRRIEQSLRVVYARNSSEVVAGMTATGAHYALFSCLRYEERAIDVATYDPPHAPLVRTLIDGHPATPFVGRELCRGNDLSPLETVYRDGDTVVVSIR